MSKHTSGPWETGKGYGLHGVEIIGNDGTRRVCGVIGVERDVKDKDGRVVATAQDIEGWANARLITAAPDLLEACRLFLGAMKTSGVSNGAIRRAEDFTRAAIAKATGGEE